MLLTGGTSFLGFHLLKVADDFEVWSLARNRPPGICRSRHFDLNMLTDYELIRDVVQFVRPRLVVHLAGQAAGDLLSTYHVNCVFAANLLSALRTVDIAATTFLAGSAAEYGPVAPESLPITEATVPNPRSVYGITKLAQTHHGLTALERGQRIIIGRIFNLVGPRMPTHLALGSFAAQINAMGPEGGILETGDLNVERDFIHVDDAARIIISLLRHSSAEGVFNLCSGCPVNLGYIVNELIRHSGRKIILRRDASRLGISTQRVNYGSPRRLRSIGIDPPRFEIDSAISSLLEP